MLNPKCPTKKGQKFIAQGSKLEHTLTVSSFYGPDGKEFTTYKAAKKHNGNVRIDVKNAEYGGGTSEEYAILLE